jgi:rhodanese-related sulfurtransferase
MFTIFVLLGITALIVLIYKFSSFLYSQSDKVKLQASKSNVVVIDCRKLHEWESGHVNTGNVLHIPLSELKESNKLPKDKNTPIMIHCAVSSLSIKSGIIL